MARPRIELTDDQIRQIEILAGYGLTETAIAHVIGVSPRSFTRRKQDHDKVLAALEKGKAYAESVIGQALYVKAKSGDLGAIVWWEKTRAGRTEKIVNETTLRDYRAQIEQVRGDLRLVS